MNILTIIDFVVNYGLSVEWCRRVL